MEQTAEGRFRSKDYLIRASADDNSLRLVVQEELSGGLWTADFTQNYIEQLTSRAANFKKFAVFVKMLSSGLRGGVPGLVLDVLNAQDLESLRASFAAKSPDKLYVVLTYLTEFDKVHYPLPLTLQEDSPPDQLRATVVRLRKELELSSESLAAGEVLLNDSEALLERVKLDKDKEIERLLILNEGLQDELNTIKPQLNELQKTVEERDLYKQELENYWNELRTLRKQRVCDQQRIHCLAATRQETPNDIDAKLSRIHSLICNPNY